MRGQMAERDRLLAEVPQVVHALLPEARPAAEELYATVLDRLTRMEGFRLAPRRCCGPMASGWRWTRARP